MGKYLQFGTDKITAKENSNEMIVHHTSEMQNKTVCTVPYRILREGRHWSSWKYIDFHLMTRPKLYLIYISVERGRSKASNDTHIVLSRQSNSRRIPCKDLHLNSATPLILKSHFVPE